MLNIRDVILLLTLGLCPLAALADGNTDSAQAAAVAAEPATAAVADTLGCRPAPGWWRWSRVSTDEDRRVPVAPRYRCDEVSEARVRLALSSNLLMDAFLIPEVKVHVGFGGCWSAWAGYRGAWWSVPGRRQFWQTQGLGAGARWHFGRESRANTLTGHHVGVFGTMMGYDFKLGPTGRQSRGLRTWSAGADYGYSIALARRLNLDVSVGVGYLDSPYIKYEYVCGHYVCKGTGHTRWVGPVSGEISLTWLIGEGNYNPAWLYK